LKTSARNKLNTIIKEIKVQELISTLCLSLTEPVIITAVITKEAAEEMDIKVGDEINIIVKPTEVFIQQITQKANE
jgi:molybdate transport system regulatory protein